MPRSDHIFFATLVLALSTLAGPVHGVPASQSSDSSSSSDAKAPAELFSLGDLRAQPPQTGLFAVENAVEEFSIFTAPQVLAANPEVVHFELPFGPRLEAVRKRFRDYGPEWKSWSGTLRRADTTDAGTGYVFFGYHGERVTGVLDFEGERYEIAGLSQPQRLVRQSAGLSEGVNCGFHGDRHAESVDTLIGAITALETEPEAVSMVPTTIDVMAVYPKAYFVSPPLQISLFDYIEDTLAQANDILDNSNINAQYNLVHMGPIVENQPTLQGPQGGLVLLNSEPMEIQKLRNAYGADFVTMFVPFYWSGFVGGAPPCGVANAPVKVSGVVDTFTGEAGLLGSNIEVSKKAFTAQRQSCGFGDFTFPHEMGHNWGMWHRAGSPPGTTLISTHSFSFYISAVDKNTAMGCQNAGGSAGTAAVCKRIDHFSDPVEKYLGIHSTGSASKNNAKMARDRLATYAAFKPTKTISPPVASFTKSCNSSTRKCTFNASGTTDNGTITKYYWNFGDGSSTTTTGATVSHTYGGSGNFYWVHLIATDNTDQRDLAVNTATF